MNFINKISDQLISVFNSSNIVIINIIHTYIHQFINTNILQQYIILQSRVEICKFYLGLFQHKIPNPNFDH